MASNESEGTTLVTGASSGIGVIYADRLARLSDTTGCAVETIVADLIDAADLARVETTLRTDAGITILLDNAGVGSAAPLLVSDVDTTSSMIALNVGAPTRLTYAMIPCFVARGTGTIVNIASIVAVTAEVLNNVYGGSKASVLAFSHSLHHEHGAQGLRIRAVLPGATATEFWNVAGPGAQARDHVRQR